MEFRQAVKNPRLLSWLQDESIASNQRCNTLGQEEHCRMVEWENATNDPVGLPERVVESVRLGRDGFTMDTKSNSTHVADRLHSDSDIGSH